MSRWIVLCLLAVATLTPDAEARRRRVFRGYSNSCRSCNSCSSGYQQEKGAWMDYNPTAYSQEKRYYEATMSLEDIAQHRADMMAKHCTRAGLEANGWKHTFPSKFYKPSNVAEGIGCSKQSEPTNVSTCLWSWRVVVADAWAVNKLGETCRVRFFK